MMSKNMSRRGLLKGVFSTSASLLSVPWLAQGMERIEAHGIHASDPVKHQFPLGFQWETQDPFLFCVHHEDHFPKGNAEMGPESSHFKGRHLGDDFIIKDGFRMYHGKTVPGFPGHPHRGFETITVVRKGFVDHADSMGASGRYGDGDVQWMTAGKGVQHSEMFPLISDRKDNPMELFQVWLNLPKKSKMTEPHFKMLWRESIPYLRFDRDRVLVELIAGRWDTHRAVAPPPGSWAAPAEHEVFIVNIKMEPHATVTLPIPKGQVNRSLYFYEGKNLFVNETELASHSGVFLKADVTTTLRSGDAPVSIFILQGKPIGEQVIQYGPFVMNTKEEIRQAFDDYHKTQFGGWPWPKYDQVHARSKGRFAHHADGRREKGA